MKISIKIVTLWIASLALFTGAGFSVLTASEWMSGVPGLAIRFFLGYCGIIVVAQVGAFLEIFCREDSTGRSRPYRTGMESA